MKYLARPRRWGNIFLILLGSVALFFVIAAWAWTAHHHVQPEQYETSHITIGGQTVTTRVPLTRHASELGLGGVTSLPDTEGMLWFFTPPSRPTFWMKGMKIGLDFIWIKNNTVTAIDANVLPPTASLELPLYEPKDNVDHVLEVAAGFSVRHHVQIGDRVTIDTP